MSAETSHLLAKDWNYAWNLWDRDFNEGIYRYGVANGGYLTVIVFHI